MVVIDEDEYEVLHAEVDQVDEKGKKIKYHKDKFYMKDMHVPPLTETEKQEWFDWFCEVMPDRFVYNDVSNIEIPTVKLVEQRPSFWNDTKAIEDIMSKYNIVEIDPKLVSKKRKERIKEFDNCLREYLNSECNAHYKIK